MCSGPVSIRESQSILYEGHCGNNYKSVSFEQLLDQEGAIIGNEQKST